MTTARHSRCLLKSLLLVASCSLAACGGGGGGGGGGNPSPPPAPAPPPAPPPAPALGYSLSQVSASAQASLTQLPPADVTIAVTITDTAAGQFGMGGLYTQSGLGFATYLRDTPTSGTLRLAFRPPQTLQPGVYHDTVTIGFCRDQACDGQMVTNQSTVDVTYTVLDAPLPSVTFSTDTVNVTALEGDARYVEPVVLNATINNPAQFAFGSGGWTVTTNGVFSASYTALGPSTGSATITLKTPNTLAAGTYTDTIDLRMCLDLDCLHPLQVTPSRITVNFTIRNSVPGPNGYTFQLSPAVATDITWNAARDVMYLAVPSTASDHANSVVEFNPLTGTYGASVPATNAWLIEVSDDGSRLYVSDQAIPYFHRYSTAPLALDTDIDLGNHPSNPFTRYTAQNVQAAPGRPEVLAVRRYDSGRDIAIFDGITPRVDVVERPYPELSHLRWDPDGSRLFTNSAVLAVTANGVTLTSTFPENLLGRLEYSGGRLISDWGQVLDVSSGTRTDIALDGYPGVGTIDAAAGRIYFLTGSRTKIGKKQIETYDLNTLARIAIGELPQYDEFLSAKRLVRWGHDGLAAVSQQGRIILVRGPLVVP